MANTSKNSLGYRINYREGTISVSERLIKEANRNGIGSTAHTTLEALMKMGMPIVKYRENTTARKGLTYSKMTKYISCCENSEQHMREFVWQREVSKSSENPYQYMVNWFNNSFPKYGEQAELNAEGKVIVLPADYLEEKKSAWLTTFDNGKENPQNQKG